MTPIPPDILSRIEELAKEHADNQHVPPEYNPASTHWAVCNRAFLAGARAMLALLAEAPEGGHPWRRVKMYLRADGKINQNHAHTNQVSPEMEYVPLSEFQSARAQDAQTIVELREELAEEKRLHELYEETTEKMGLDFVNERARADLLAKRVADLEEALIEIAMPAENGAWSNPADVLAECEAIARQALEPKAKGAE